MDCTLPTTTVELADHEKVAAAIQTAPAPPKGWGDIRIDALNSTAIISFSRRASAQHLRKITGFGSACHTRDGSELRFKTNRLCDVLASVKMTCKAQHDPDLEVARIKAVQEKLFHPAAELFPLILGSDFYALAEDIRTHGLQVPIEYYNGQIIDGRNRYLVCEKLGIEPTVIDLDDKIVTDPVAYVLSLNLHRRHLNESQRAMIGAKVLELHKTEAKERQKRKPADSVPAIVPEQKGDARDKAGAAVKVSGRSIDKAAKVLANGAPEVVSAVEAGELSVSKASKIVDLPVEEQPQALDSDYGVLQPVDPRDTGFSFDESFERIRTSIQKVEKTWPQDQRLALANILRGFGDQVERFGGILPGHKKWSRADPTVSPEKRRDWAIIHVKELADTALHQCRLYREACDMSAAEQATIDSAGEVVRDSSDLFALVGALGDLEELVAAYDEADNGVPE